ncbi:peptidase M24 (plasmid) [Gemmatirosa kalamazoonensis]|uniref:Peptidase M24 n=1 Tax=Gemmatirosa kalamazoonensis TaxID=861299 RepID=W0RMZ3_9BACT|nr:Xaa-Pro peptidase family protein [Gemmatirosa kalamazoonensis]AHG92409.1 peptidase M24 [Gemmatirosa kalamazoonensis]
MRRRDFWKSTLGLLGASALPRGARAEMADDCDLPAPIAKLTPMTAGIVKITDDERRARIEKARRLMTEHGIDALVLEPGSSLFYFTGVQWGLSERPFVAVLPAKGDLAYVAPGFEEARAREQTRFSNDVRVWQEDESPYRVVAQILRERGVGTGRVGVEERMRFFVVDGVRRELPQATFVEAVPVTAGCRMIKSPAEIALMQRANDVTLAAYKAAFATLHEGMTQFEFQRNVESAFARLGVPNGSAGAQFGQYSAYPHGSVTPQKLRAGDVVLVDGGCKVEGYSSDITRTGVFGTPSKRQREVWDLEHRAQDAAFRAARPGATCESVDAAARKVITDAGFGPDYKVPGLPHRTGHGIGLDGHEWTNFVRGNTTVIQPGMCFSDEPMIAIYGEFGIRLEDCLYITESGPRFFTAPATSIDRLFG